MGHQTVYHKNDRLEATVQALCGNGNGLVKLEDGFVVFVANAAPGDVVRIRLIKVTKQYAVGKIETLLQPSAIRVADGCPYSGKCGGCAFSHLQYAAEAEYKRQWIEESFERIGGFSLPLEHFYAAKSCFSYRNKAIYPVSTARDGTIVCGFYAPMSHRIIEHDTCLIEPNIFTDIAKAVVDFCNKRKLVGYCESDHTGLVRAIYLRTNAALTQIALTLVLNDQQLKNGSVENDFVQQILSRFPTVTTVLVNVNTERTNVILGKQWRVLYGSGFVFDVLSGRSFRVSPASFFQVNPEMTDILYSVAKQFANVKQGEKLLDLYCGTGSVGICLSEPGTKLIGVDITQDAVTDASFNAKSNGVDAQFICLDAGEALDSERITALKPDLIAVDPPRKGCGKDAVEKMSRLDAKRIVYISCDPTTLARDIVQFQRAGYQPERAAGVDLFPRTGHVETVVLMSRVEK